MENPSSIHWDVIAVGAEQDMYAVVSFVCFQKNITENV